MAKKSVSFRLFFSAFLDNFAIVENSEDEDDGGEEYRRETDANQSQK